MSVIFYFTASGAINSATLTVFIIGIMFVIIGNYLPKTTQNSTIGIKIPWSLNNEENWNKTHRFSGRVWVIGGLLIMILTLIPGNIAVYFLVALLIILTVLPIIYSFWYYKKQVSEGTYSKKPVKYNNKKITAVSSVAIILILVAVLILMFTGEIKYNLTFEELSIKPTYWYQAAIHLDDIDKIELKTDFNKGFKNMGFNSAKLSFGSFENEENGEYIIYAYNKCDSAILITSGKSLIVINDCTDEQTESLYNDIKEKL